MKKNIFLIIALALVGTATFTLTNLRAQTDATPGGPPPAGQAPPPNRPGGLPPGGFRSRPGGNNYRAAITFLKRAKMDLEHSKEDYDGHRQTAMDACDKALAELEAVQASIQAAAKAAAAAAQQAPAPAAPAAPVTPAPPQ